VLDALEYAQDAGDTGVIRTRELRTSFDARSPQRDVMLRHLRAAVENGEAGLGVKAAQELMREIRAGSVMPAEATGFMLYTVAEIVLETFADAVPSDTQELERLRQKDAGAGALTRGAGGY
jgi:hypothetical protein